MDSINMDNGFRIDYIETDGSKHFTFFGMPMASFKISEDDVADVVTMMFGNAHPGCKIISMEKCSAADYDKMISK